MSYEIVTVVVQDVDDEKPEFNENSFMTAVSEDISKIAKYSLNIYNIKLRLWNDTLNSDESKCYYWFYNILLLLFLMCKYLYATMIISLKFANITFVHITLHNDRLTNIYSAFIVIHLYG